MCRTCEKVRVLPKKEALELIGAEMNKGKNFEHFKRILDSILDTEEVDSDPDLDRAWANNRAS